MLKVVCDVTSAMRADLSKCDVVQNKSSGSWCKYENEESGGVVAGAQDMRMSGSQHLLDKPNYIEIRGIQRP